MHSLNKMASLFFRIPVPSSRMQVFQFIRCIYSSIDYTSIGGLIGKDGESDEESQGCFKEGRQ